MGIPQNIAHYNCCVCKAKPIAIIQTTSTTECEVAFLNGSQLSMTEQQNSINHARRKFYVCSP